MAHKDQGDVRAYMREYMRGWRKKKQRLPGGMITLDDALDTAPPQAPPCPPEPGAHSIESPLMDEQKKPRRRRARTKRVAPTVSGDATSSLASPAADPVESVVAAVSTDDAGSSPAPVISGYQSYRESKNLERQRQSEILQAEADSRRRESEQNVLARAAEAAAAVARQEKIVETLKGAGLL